MEMERVCVCGLWGLLCCEQASQGQLRERRCLNPRVEEMGGALWTHRAGRSQEEARTSLRPEGGKVPGEPEAQDGGSGVPTRVAMVTSHPLCHQALDPSPVFLFVPSMSVSPGETVSAQSPRRTDEGPFLPTGNLALRGGGMRARLEVGFVDESMKTHLETRLLGQGLPRGFLTSWLGAWGSC